MRCAKSPEYTAGSSVFIESRIDVDQRQMFEPLVVTPPTDPIVNVIAVLARPRWFQNREHTFN